MKLWKKQIWILLLCAYIAAVAYLCFAKPDDLPAVRPDIFGIPFDKLVHFLMFFPFPIVAYESFAPKGDRTYTHIIVLVLISVVGAGLAIGTEHVQGLLGYRSEDVNDFYADLTGIGSSAFITAIYILIRHRRT